jgi:LTXXQ motif family protein
MPRSGTSPGRQSFTFCASNLERIMRRGNLAVLCLATGLAVAPTLTHANPLGPSEASVAAALREVPGEMLLRVRHHHRRDTARPASEEATEAPSLNDDGSASWAGSVFWPSASKDTFGYILLNTRHAGFWGHGYGDIYGAMLGSGMAYTIASGRDAAAPEISCRDAGDAAGSLAIARINGVLHLSKPQSVRLDELRAALGKGGERLRASCSSVALLVAPTSRLTEMWERVRALRQAVGIVRLPLRDFYSSLSNEQKAQLEAASSSKPETRPRAKPAGASALAPGQEGNACTASGTGAAHWPGDELEGVIRPTEAQRNLWLIYNSTSAKLPDLLKSSCPTEMPFTPTGRLEAVEDRLDGLLYAVTTEHSALGRFYAMLNDEQKARFATALLSPRGRDGVPADQRATATSSAHQ